jgi:predicted trehalose synthase
MTKRASGGKRAVEKKHALREAERLRAAGGTNHRDLEVAGFRAARSEGDAPVDVLGEAIAHLREALRQAGDDTAMPPEQKREQISRIAEKLGKLAEPKKIIEELGAELREAHEVIQGLKNAAQEPPRDSQGAPSASQH